MPLGLNKLYMLWFDVERRYNSTVRQYLYIPITLWFDVERRYNSTDCEHAYNVCCCGLM